jgi:hypothetical protein
VVRAAGADDVDGVRAIAQLQHTVDGPSRILGDCRRLGLVRSRPRDGRPATGMPVLRDLTVDRGRDRSIGRSRGRGRPRSRPGCVRRGRRVRGA